MSLLMVFGINNGGIWIHGVPRVEEDRSFIT